MEAKNGKSRYQKEGRRNLGGLEKQKRKSHSRVTQNPRGVRISAPVSDAGSRKPFDHHGNGHLRSRPSQGATNKRPRMTLFFLEFLEVPNREGMFAQLCSLLYLM
jgi:hypothetical protein